MSEEYVSVKVYKPLTARPNLPILYINSQEQADEAPQSHLAESNQQFDVSKLRRIFLICGASFRGKFDAFSVRVPQELEANMMLGDAFVFCNCSKNQISVLQRQHDGFAQYFKRSDYGEFPWPNKKGIGAIEITPEDFKMLMEYPRLKLRLSGNSAPKVSIINGK